MQPYIMDVMRYLAVLLLALATLARGQSGPTSQDKSQKPAVVKPSLKGTPVRPDEGSVAGGVYTEKFFNLSCTVPQNWVVKTASMREGLSTEQDSLLLFSAFAKDSPAAGEVNPSLTISAEPLAAYPDTKSADDYFSVISEVVVGKGFTVLNEPAEIEIGGVSFVRGDFQKEEADGTTYQATMVTIRKGYVLAVTAISGREDDLTPLLNRVRVFAPPTLGRQ